MRMARLGAVCALTLGCVLAAPAQDSSNAATKTAPAEKATSSTSSQEHHSAPSASISGKKSTSKTHTASSGKRSRRKSRARGQQKIDSARAEAIQEALIREHYLKGEPNGTWNQACEDAMRKYQADHGWQSKTVPDSRALISLGLGPSKDHLLNPESAMTTVPDRPKSEAPPASHSAAPAANPVPPASSAPATSSPDTNGPSRPQ